MLRSILSSNEGSHPTPQLVFKFKIGCRQNDDVLSTSTNGGRLAVELPPRSGNTLERNPCNWLCRTCLGGSTFRRYQIGRDGQFAFVRAPLLAQASGEDTMARCQQLFGIYDRLNSDGYAKPLDARMALEDCRKGNIVRGVAALKRVFERAQIPVPPTESASAAAAPAPLKPHGEKRRLSQ